MAGKFKVIYSPSADKDLDEILHYHLEQYGRSNAATTLAVIREKMDTVLKMPEAYPLYRPGGRVFQKSYRYVIAKKRYRVIYTVEVLDEVVRVVRIAHKKFAEGSIIMRIEEE